MFKFERVILCFLLLQGCMGIGGFWMTGNQFSGLKNVTAYLTLWQKTSVSPEQRRQDSVACGGNASDRYPTSFNDGYVEKRMLPGETYWQADSRLNDDWKRCMLDKGYIYTGHCYDNEIGRNSLACKGRQLEPLK